MPDVLLSIVIPVRRDEPALRQLLAGLGPQPRVQLIVSATEAAPAWLRADRPDVQWVVGPAGRGVQLNAGASRAAGRWLWFVHADCTIPGAYLAAFEGLDRDADVVGGAFRFALDSQAWQARLWERGVALRVRLFHLPYGDQGIFARRDVFERLGGFRPFPLMEDVDFVRRLNRAGPVRHLKEQLVTSARRWQEDGWCRRSSRNLMLLTLYYGGVAPDRLARWYETDRRSIVHP